MTDQMDLSLRRKYSHHDQAPTKWSTRSNQRRRITLVTTLSLLIFSSSCYLCKSPLFAASHFETFNRQPYILQRNDFPYILKFPQQTKRVYINIGPNLTPILPPTDESVAVLAIEANTAVANILREKFQKKFPNRFFVINVAMGGSEQAGTIAQFHYYNNNGLSSSLSKAIINTSWADTERYSPKSELGPGPAGFDFVGVLDLESILKAIPDNIAISVLKVDTQGHDFAILRSVIPKQLRRVEKIITETYLMGIGKRRYEGVTNDLKTDWIPFMSSIGFILSNPPSVKVNVMQEYDAIWIQTKN